jgi:hypothetical protein
MKLETAQSLISAIGNASNLAIDAQNKITSLENVLKKEQPTLYSAYQKELEEVRKNPHWALSMEALSAIQQALVQDTR